jgi:hypothetical protein
MNRSALHVKRAFFLSGIGLGIALAVTAFFAFWQTSEAFIDPSVRYRVLRGVFVLDTIPGDEAPTAADQIRHQELWQYVQKIAPRQIEDSIAYFEIGTDGYSAELAHVVQSGIGKEYWTLLLDEEDAAGPKGRFESVTVNETIVHELAHILFATEDQIDLDETLYRSATVEEWDERYLELARGCEGNYMTTEGCSKDDSYINAFYQAFWADLDVYPSYDDYVTWYAVTSVDEDIAESFMVFVLEDRPKASVQIRHKKVDFFWEYPEFVEMREEMRDGLQ